MTSAAFVPGTTTVYSANASVISAARRSAMRGAFGLRIFAICRVPALRS